MKRISKKRSAAFVQASEDSLIDYQNQKAMFDECSRSLVELHYEIKGAIMKRAWYRFVNLLDEYFISLGILPNAKELDEIACQVKRECLPIMWDFDWRKEIKFRRQLSISPYMDETLAMLLAL